MIPSRTESVHFFMLLNSATKGLGVLKPATEEGALNKQAPNDLEYKGSMGALTHRPLSSSFLWFIFRILYGNPKKELLRGLWVVESIEYLRGTPTVTLKRPYTQRLQNALIKEYTLNLIGVPIIIYGILLD